MSEEEAQAHADRQRQLGSQLFALGEEVKIKEQLLASLAKSAETVSLDAANLASQVCQDFF